MKTTVAILAALAYLAALTTAEEPAAKAEAAPIMRDADTETAPINAEGETPEGQEYYRGYGGGGGYGYRGGYGGGYGGRYGGGYGGRYGHWPAKRHAAQRLTYLALFNWSPSTQANPHHSPLATSTNMKTSTAIAFTLVALMSFAAAAEQPNSMDMGAMTTDLDQAMPSDQATTSDQAMASLLSGHRSPALLLPAGVVSNKVNAANNNVLVSNSNILLSKSDRVQLAQTIKEMMIQNPEAAGPAGSMTAEDIFGLLTRIASNPTLLSHAAGIITSARSGDTGALAGHVTGLLGAALPLIAPTAIPVVAPIAAAPMVAPVAAAPVMIPAAAAPDTVAPASATTTTTST